MTGMRVPVLLVPAFFISASASLLMGCGGSSPAGASSTRYQADYASCDKTVPEAVNKRNAKTGLAWFASPVTRWSQIDNGVNRCMQAKGWGAVRPCTDEERRQGAGSLVVTARGINCRDPDRPS